MSVMLIFRLKEIISYSHDVHLIYVEMYVMRCFIYLSVNFVLPFIEYAFVNYSFLAIVFGVFVLITTLCIYYGTQETY